MTAADSMHLARVAFLPLLCVAGCAVVAPGAPVAPAPEPVATAPTSSPPAAGAAPATAQPVPTAPPAAAAAAIEDGKKAAAPGAQTSAAPTQRPGAPAAAGTAPRPAPPPTVALPAPAAAPALDLNALKNQLKETDSIGAFTKLTLKNQMDDLLQQFRDHHQGKGRITLAQLRRSYDLLLMKVLSLVQDSDRKLASAIVASREALWSLLADPKKFAALDV